MVQVRKRLKYPMYAERLRERLLERDATRPPITGDGPRRLTTDEAPDPDEGGNFFKGAMIAMLMSIPFWLLVGFLIRWMM